MPSLRYSYFPSKKLLEMDEDPLLKCVPVVGRMIVETYKYKLVGSKAKVSFITNPRYFLFFIFYILFFYYFSVMLMINNIIVIFLFFNIYFLFGLNYNFILFCFFKTD